MFADFETKMIMKYMLWPQMCSLEVEFNEYGSHEKNQSQASFH